jgi:serine/threonine-protein kinase RsbW
VDLATKVVILSKLSEARRAEQKILDAVARCGYDEAATFAIKLAVEEAVNNAIKHGNKFDPTKTVEVSFDIDAKHVAVVVCDQGDGFDPDDLPDPTSDENLEKPTGRGVMLRRAYMDEVVFNKKGNRVRMVKRNR